ncbi:hypothetical protein ACFVAD_01820 [Sutcliffiella sp. NPDC057660]|uniref:hypothetical protein n=1 Tax=Sutcliffiella sp. NPDC057660 TaxID=3346199 RepID=UPI0036B13F14
MDTFLDLINIVTNYFSIFSKEVTEERIEKNLGVLQKLDWFRELLANETYHQLIHYNTDVRYEIGRLNTKKVEKNPSNPRFQRAIKRAILKAEE